MSTHQVRLALPAAYRNGDVLAFHARDAEGVSEQVGERDGQACIRKAVVLGGVPTLLEVGAWLSALSWSACIGASR